MNIEATVFKGSATEGIVESKTYLDSPTASQVLVKIRHSGICGTDEHFKHADMVLGHEGVGTVVQIGGSVLLFKVKVGDIVGWGYTHKTCGQCEQCLLGCPGSHAVWDASFLFKVPDGLAPEHAAPLMCAGAAVFEVIETYNIHPTNRVGVVGLGGLGHLAIQVVVFSSTDSKCAEALRLGATEFYVTQGVTEFAAVPRLDHLFVYWHYETKGTIYPITVTFDDLVIPFLPSMIMGLTFQFVIPPARSVHKKMLDSAARHHIELVIEQFPITKEGVEQVWRMACIRKNLLPEFTSIPEIWFLL
ncbi:chaperonin 10-like protein [Mycena haematopus]|nr:chaperonin 10-like protein [Mycena haematopus]